MKKKIFIHIILLFCISNSIFSQEYFQQEVNTKILVTLDDKSKTLNGNIEIQYINNSPKDLNYIYFHLYPNAYKNKDTEYAKQRISVLRKSDILSRHYKKGFIDSLDFFVNGEKATLENVEEDIVMLILPEILKAGDTIIIKTPFFVKLPEKKDRLGYKKDFYSITQWFPKPAVYDKNGWHPISYLSVGEFYSEFGKYDVTITLRDDYIVAATGNLTTKSEINRINNFVEICKKAKDIGEIPKFGNSEKYKTINFTENNIHDFAWFASPDFLIENETIISLELSQLVNCWSFYSRKAEKNWKNSIRYVKQSVEFFSGQIGEYPYKNCSVVEFSDKNDGGMEYPTISLISSDSRFTTERIIAHEIAHNWFYGILAPNERNDQWIDEGFTSFYENKYLDFYYPNLTLSEALLGKNRKIFGWNNLPAKIENEFFYNYLQHENLTQAPDKSTEKQSLANYFANSYAKTTMAIYTLEGYIGYENFENIINLFYDKYKYQHIDIETIKSFFTENTDKNINWFFEDLIESNKISDYKVKRVKNDSVIIANKGKTLIPLFLNIGDSTIITDGFAGEKKFALNGNKEIIIDKNYLTIDNNRRNNSYSSNFFKRFKPISFRIANFIDNPQTFDIPILPIPTYNNTDGFMLGLAFYTPPIPKRRFEFQLIPLWAFKTGTITGLGNFSLFFQPQKTIFNEIELFTNFKSFSITKIPRQYFTVATGLKINLKTEAKDEYESEFILKNISATDYYSQSFQNFQSLSYLYANNRYKNPYQIIANLENGKNYTKVFVEITNTFHYNYKDRGINIRLFGGIFLRNKTNDGKYNFKLSGNIGSEDYLYDNLYLGRNDDIRINPESFFSHQFVRNDGGFALFSPVGQSNKWMLGLNFDANTFFKTVDIFFNVGMSPDTKIKVYYEGGIKLSFLKNVIEIFFPLFGTPEIWKNNKDFYTKNYLQKVRFTLSLEKLNLLKYRKKPYILY
ncbi:MAG: M1 family metallopeptidase [Bacteroidales bacterium]|jgi:hypothetical protein|nr:M1 family metallopeptidase [Bacteroidales bacterium]